MISRTLELCRNKTHLLNLQNPSPLACSLVLPSWYHLMGLIFSIHFYTLFWNGNRLRPLTEEKSVTGPVSFSLCLPGSFRWNVGTLPIVHLEDFAVSWVHPSSLLWLVQILFFTLCFPWLLLFLYVTSNPLWNVAVNKWTHSLLNTYATTGS